jgi:membrane protease YdiL (CAAX protease family)
MSIKQTNKFILYSFLSQIIVAVIINHLFNHSNIFYFIFLQIFPLGLPILYFFIKTKENFRDVILLNKINKKNFFRLILLVLFIQTVMYFLDFLILNFTKIQQVDISELFSLKYFSLIIILFSIAPTILEEIFFRGIILYGYKNKNLALKQIFFINGLLFAVMHLNLEQFIYALPMGYLLAMLVYYTQSIYPSFIIHFIFNTTQIYIEYSLINKQNKIYKTITFLQNNYFHSNQLIKFFIIALLFYFICVKLIKDIIKDCNIKKK